MPLPLRSRPHQNTMPGPLVSVEEATRYDIPTTEDGWDKLKTVRKRDMNDLAYELGPKGFAKWLDEGTTYVTKWPETGDDIVSAGTLLSSYKAMRRPIIHGLLRETETMNIVAAPKMNKSFLVGNICMNVIGGGKLFNQFQCERGRVLACDNELHEETLAERLRVLAPALNVPLDRVARLIDFMPLRGQLVDIEQLETRIEKIRHRAYAVIILDALYKFYPDNGFDESDNAAMARLYTRLDSYAEYTGSAFILIHHASKGDQSGKEVTDIGAGAGAQSRACDAHMALRRHKESGVYVIDCANRSFPPIKKFCARFKFPVWEEAVDKDPEELAGLENKKRVGRPAKPENPASAPGGEYLGQPAESDQPQTAPESLKQPAPKPEVQLDPKAREAMRLCDFVAGLVSPTTATEMLDLGKHLGFSLWHRDHLTRILIPQWLENGLLRCVGEAVGQRGAVYQCQVAPAKQNAPEAPQSEMPDVSDDEAYGPDLYANDSDDEPPPWSREHV